MNTVIVNIMIEQVQVQTTATICLAYFWCWGISLRNEIFNCTEGCAMSLSCSLYGFDAKLFSANLACSTYNDCSLLFRLYVFFLKCYLFCAYKYYALMLASEFESSQLAHFSQLVPPVRFCTCKSLVFSRAFQSSAFPDKCMSYFIL